MTKISITYSVADNETYDRRGRRQARVEESYEGIDTPPRTFVIPGTLIEPFIRARRNIAQRILASHGYSKHVPIDWSFLEKGTKQ
jgi:hypothetical protein